MTSDRLVTVHWGANEGAAPVSVEVLPGVTAVDGRRVRDWADSAAAGRDGPPLSPAQVDLAWQTVVTAIGRPDLRWSEPVYRNRSRLGSRMTVAIEASSSGSHA